MTESSAPESPLQRPHPSTRAAIALAGGVAVGILTYLGGWQQAMSFGTVGLFDDHYAAFTELGEIAEQIAEYRQANHRLPASLSLVPTRFPKYRYDEFGELLDPWEHAYQYKPAGESFDLFSLGRDGAPGGDGLDADIRRIANQPPPRSATLQQFTFELPTGGIKLASVVSGICTAIACWMLCPKYAKETVGQRFLSWVMTIGLAVLITQFMAYLHIPTGH